MPQFLRPDSNITQTSFTGGFADIDESTASDTDFAYGAINTAAVLEVGLTNPVGTPGTGTYTIRYRIARTNGATVDGGGNSVNVTAALYQGGTLISSDSAQTATGTWTQYSWNPNTASITDWSNVRLRFTTTASGGAPAARRGAGVSWAEFEVPDAGIIDISAGLTGVGSVSGNAPLTRPASSSLSGSASLASTATLITNNGIRFTESNDRRITQNGDVRVLEGYVAAGTTYSETKTLSGALSVALIASLTRNATSSLVGSLAQLSASTVSRGAVAALTASGALTGSAAQAKNFIASIAGSGTAVAKLGYQFTVSSSQSSSGTIAASAQIIKDVSSTRNATSSFDFIADVTRTANASLSANGSITGIILGNNDVNLDCAASGSLVATAKLIFGASSSLAGSSEAFISPQFLQGFAALKAGQSTLSATLLSVTGMLANCSSTGSLNGNAQMILTAASTPGIDRRITEAGDIRITQTGDFRITGDGKNTASGTVTASLTQIPFTPNLYAYKVGAWRDVTPRVKRSGVWIIPSVYVNQNGSWKRVY